jgi:hypothetical protein
MRGVKISKKNLLALGLAISFLLLFLAVGARAEKPEAAGLVKGVLVEEGLAFPVDNAVVRIRNASEGREYLSGPTNEKGVFEIRGVEEGRYGVEVITAEGRFELARTVLIKAGEVADLSLELQSGGLMAGLPGVQGFEGIYEMMGKPRRPHSPWKPPGKPPWVPGPPPWAPGPPPKK